MMKNPYLAYQKTSVTTASKEKILLMLYEGAIRFVKTAHIRMKENNVAEKGKNISKALAIITELSDTLDHKVGGQLASDLESLYMFMCDQLIDANIHNKVENLEAVEKLLKTLYEAWSDVVNNPRPDGVPSKEHQKDLYKEAQSEATALKVPSKKEAIKGSAPTPSIPPRKKAG